MMTVRVCAVWALVAVVLCACGARADEIKKEVIPLNSNNFQETIASREFVIVNFYADWCRFSQMLAPVFDQAAAVVSSERVMLAKVNCEVEPALAQSNHITKYPTLKIYRRGEASKREYRGERTVKAIEEFIKGQLESGLKIAPTAQDVVQFLDRHRRIVIGFFAEEKGPNDMAAHFDAIAEEMRDDCTFVRVVSERVALAAGATAIPSVVFREVDQKDLVYEGPQTKDELKKWASELCHPLVREITFENAEALTEEGLPFLILFHLPDERKSVADFTAVVKERFAHLKGTMNFITADALKFMHPLQHMGKSKADVPVLAIDSFQHMYDFGPFQEIGVPGRLEQFIADFNSGLLHHRFHNAQQGQGQGQQPPAPPALPADPNANAGDGAPPADNGAQQQQPPAGDKPAEDGGEQRRDVPAASPAAIPESTFKKLQPSKNRYSLRKRDEL